MTVFIASNIFMLSVGLVLYVVARTLPRIDVGGGEDKRNIFDRWVHSEVPEKVDVVLNAFLAKVLRRAKVFLLKSDNFVSDKLQRVSANGNGKPKIDFKDLHHKATKPSVHAVHKEEEVAKSGDLSK